MLIAIQLNYRDIVLNNWLVNPTGKESSWVEVDLMQEHMNYWIKVSTTDMFPTGCYLTESPRPSTKRTAQMRRGNG